MLEILLNQTIILAPCERHARMYDYGFAQGNEHFLNFDKLKTIFVCSGLPSLEQQKCLERIIEGFADRLAFETF